MSLTSGSPIQETSSRWAWNDWKNAHGHWSIPYLVEAVGAASVSGYAVIIVTGWGWSVAGQVWTGVIAFIVALALWGLFVYLFLWIRAPYKQRDELRRLLSTGSNEPSIDSILEQAAPLVELAVNSYLFEENEPDEGIARGFGRVFGRHRARTEFAKASDALRTLSIRCNERRRAIIEEFIAGIEEVAWNEDFSKSQREQRGLATAVFDKLKRQLDTTA
ncbi:MAG: hypothetical protein O3B04_06600 [Chloroflexi bacterium]|nr:hypothetical protein [Chloroflexota bacterium]